MALKAHLFRRWFVVVAILTLSCSDNDGPAPAQEEKVLVEATARGSLAASNLKVFAQLTGQDIDISKIIHDVDIYYVVYETTYKDTEINASGLIFLPRAATSAPMVSFHRGTTVRQADAPSAQSLQSEQVLSYSALTSMGFITVVPDLIGFGASADILHPYYVYQPTADAVRDMLLAARELAEEKSVGFDERLFLAGYSQGGYVTMAAHKSLEADPIDGFTIIASFPAAGGYDLNHMLELLRPAPGYPDPYYLAYIGMSYQLYYDEEGLIDAFFNEPYASKIPGLFNGVNGGSNINSELTESIPELVREEVLADSESYPANAFLEEKFAENSPIDWTPVAPMYMYHGNADEVVPVQNSYATYERLLDNGADPDNLHLTILEGRTHGSGVVPYIAEVVKKLMELK